MMNARFVSRVRITAAVCVLGAFIIIGRLYMLQVVHGESYALRADAQFTPPAAPLMERNAIYFSSKEGEPILAATTKSGYALAINPAKVENLDILYNQIADLIPLSREDFVHKVSAGGRQYALIAEHLSTTTGSELRVRNLPGTIVESDRWRFYPGGSLAAQEVGFVAYDGDEQNGRYGLERYYEQTLARNGEDLYNNFFVELFGAAREVLSGEEQTGSLLTTIEPNVQAELERTLAAYSKEWLPKLAGGIIMDPETGEILAMAVHPTFDLNDFSAQGDPLIFANPLIENVYEMGSIIKPLTVAAGLDSGAITPTTTYDDTGCITLDQKKICNFDGEARGVVDMQEVLSQSLNLGVSFIANKMGSDTVRDYFLQRFGLGSETGIDLPGEVQGLVHNIESSPRRVEYATASFGQGIATTPISTVRALATLANGGKLVTPHLVRAIRYDTGLTRTLSWESSGQALKPESALEVGRMLTKVVDEALVKGANKLEHYSVAAKTGTAQIANPEGGGYYTDRFLHSFFGYFPSYDARFITFLFALEPQGASYASQTLASPFHSLTTFLISYYDVPPDR